MAYGPDTEELLRRISECTTTLNVSRLRITSLPDLPSSLKYLICSHTPITKLPDLPSSLESLECSKTTLTHLPDLPSSIKELDCRWTSLTHLPELPSSLEKLYCSFTQLTHLPDLPSSLIALVCDSTHITHLPDLPSGLKYLICDNIPLILPRYPKESVADYNARWNTWREEQAAKKRSQERANQIHEDLVAAAWHPKRVARLVALGGYEVLDSL